MRRRAALAILSIIPASAGFVKVWQLKETETAPVLITGEVVSIQRGARVPQVELKWKTETWRMTADVRVLRYHTRSGKPILTDHLRVSFLQYDPHQALINATPLPNLAAGKTFVLPLTESETLVAVEGSNTILPARSQMPEPESPPDSAHAFLLREISNALEHGTPSEIFAVASYLSNQDQNLAPELMPSLGAAIGDDRERWAEVASSLRAATGIPGPQVPLAQAVLLKLKPSAQTDGLLIKTLIADAPVHAWGSANALLDYGDNPVLTETLRRALSDNVAGSSYIAWTLIRNGHNAVLPEAIARALKVCDQPKEGDFTDLQGAAALLRDFGSDQDLDRLAALVRKYQALDRQFYSVLWQYGTESDNPREARVLSVVLNDREPLHDDLRVCDFALYVLERASGEDFHAGAPSRDDALARARVWLDVHGIPR